MRIEPVRFDTRLKVKMFKTQVQYYSRFGPLKQKTVR